MKRAVLSLSGGMDSTGLLINFLANDYKVSALSFDYGQKHKLELERLSDNLAYLKENGYEVEHTVLDVSQIGNLYNSALVSSDTDVPEGFYEQENMKLTVVPNRNMIFFSMIAGYALSIATKENCQVDIGLGVHSGDHAIYPDCRPEFYVEAMNAFKVGNWDSDLVSLKLPYLNGDKFTILQDTDANCVKLNLDFNTVLKNTNTSYAPDEKGRASGKTGSDVERILAFWQLGTQDPVEYVGGWDEVLENALKLQQEFQENK
jgi:7-cyano-7-deazaguanine synthase